MTDPPPPAPSDGDGGAERHDRRYPDTVRRVVLALAVARFVVPIAALALLPGLFREEVADRLLYVVIALRPGREVMLFAGYRVRADGEPPLVLLYLAAVPLFVVAVWLFFLLGRVYRPALRVGPDGRPPDADGRAWLHRVAPPDRVEIAQRALARRGPAVAFLARVGGLPPTILAAAAGVSDTRPLPYLAADALGSVAVYAVTVGVGYSLGEAYQRSGPWFTAAALVAVIGLATWFNRWMQRELEREDGGQTSR